VKAHAERVRLDPASSAGHSLRAEFLTSAAKRGAKTPDRTFDPAPYTHGWHIDAIAEYLEA
jgi:hypothetical protein